MFSRVYGHDNVITIRDGDRETYIWTVDGRWFFGHSFDSGGNGPFPSFDAAIEEWRRQLSRDRGRKELGNLYGESPKKET